MRIQENILIIILTLLLSAAGAFAAYPQTELPPEKKKALRKFDPADIFPEVRGSEGGRDRKGPGQNPGRPALTRGAAPPTVPAGSAPQPGEGSGRGRTTPPPATSLLVPTALPAPTQPALPGLRSSEPLLVGSSKPAITVSRSARATGLSLHFIFLLLGLTFLALFAVIIKLKNELRKH